jgi:hypothetical protein
MNLHYAGRCHVCNGDLATGARGFYDPATRKVTCTAIKCAGQDGLTTMEWYGAPTSGRFIERLNDHRIGNGYDSGPSTPARRGNRAGNGFVRKYGRCEDAPCCGCCD